MTPGGDLKTNYKCQCTFVMPEFFQEKVIEWDLHVWPNLGAYDMIIGRDILSALGFKFDFATMTIEWDHAHVPMKDSEQAAEELFYVQDPEAVLDATLRLKGILDAKYEQADLHEVAASASHLAVEEQSHLQEALTEYSDLFDGTLTWGRMTSNYVQKPRHIMLENFLFLKPIRTL
jgi:hypothetical protein